jgi:hypothetical protein
MEISIVEQKAYLIPEAFSPEQARERAWDKKTSVFSSGLSSVFSRPKGEDVEVTYNEKRYEPFWYILCQGHYIYERKVRYAVKVTGPEVNKVTVTGEDYCLVNDPKQGAQTFFLPALEHCHEDLRKEAFFEGVSGERADFSSALKFTRQEIVLDRFAPDGLVIAPEIRASFVVRQLLQEMIKPIQADKILEEGVTIERLELYYKPLYAFEYHWKSKDKQAVAEFDGLNGQMRTGGKTLRQTISGKLSRDMLFDLGADVAGLVLPGGSIAVKLTKAALDMKDKEKTS